MCKLYLMHGFSLERVINGVGVAIEMPAEAEAETSESAATIDCLAETRCRN